MPRRWLAGTPPPKRSSRGKFFMIGLICVALLAGVGVFVVVRAKSAASMRRQQASVAAAQFLRAWASGNLSALPAQTVTGSAAVGPALKVGDHVQVTRTVPRRGAILGADGQPVPNTFDVSALVGAVGPATT